MSEEAEIKAEIVQAFKVYLDKMQKAVDHAYIKGRADEKKEWVEKNLNEDKRLN